MSMRNDYGTAVDGHAVLDYCQNCPIVTTNPTTRRPRRRGVCDCEGHDKRNCQTVSTPGGGKAWKLVHGTNTPYPKVSTVALPMNPSCTVDLDYELDKTMHAFFNLETTGLSKFKHHTLCIVPVETTHPWPSIAHQWSDTMCCGRTKIDL